MMEHSGGEHFCRAGSGPGTLTPRAATALRGVGRDVLEVLYLNLFGRFVANHAI